MTPWRGDGWRLVDDADGAGMPVDLRDAAGAAVSSRPVLSTGRAPSRVVSFCARFVTAMSATVIVTNATPVFSAE